MFVYASAYICILVVYNTSADIFGLILTKLSGIVRIISGKIYMVSKEDSKGTLTLCLTAFLAVKGNLIAFSHSLGNHYERQMALSFPICT